MINIHLCPVLTYFTIHRKLEIEIIEKIHIKEKEKIEIVHSIVSILFEIEKFAYIDFFKTHFFL